MWAVTIYMVSLSHPICTEKLVNSQVQKVSQWCLNWAISLPASSLVEESQCAWICPSKTLGTQSWEELSLQKWKGSDRPEAVLDAKSVLCPQHVVGNIHQGLTVKMGDICWLREAARSSKSQVGWLDEMGEHREAAYVNEELINMAASLWHHETYMDCYFQSGGGGFVATSTTTQLHTLWTTKELSDPAKKDSHWLWVKMDPKEEYQSM